MNFNNLDDIKEHLNSFKRTPLDPSTNANANYFGKIELNSFYINFMAGDKSLCEPRTFFDEFMFYKKVQVSINEIIKGQEHAVQPCTDDRFKGFEWLKYFTYTNTKGQIKTSYMGDMVPIGDVMNLIRDVYKISRLKIFF